jgi:hypothetical protein
VVQSCVQETGCSTSLELWQLIRDTDNGRLSKIVSVKDDDLRDLRRDKTGKNLRHRLPFRALSPDIQRRLLPGDLIIPAELLLIQDVNDKLRDNPVGDLLRLNGNNKLEGFRRPGSLLSAMWLQFYYYISGLTDFRRCDLCHKWENLAEHNSNWHMHKECATRARTAKAYEEKKKREAEAKKTVAKKPVAKKATAKKPASKKAAKGGAK